MPIYIFHEEDYVRLRDGLKKGIDELRLDDELLRQPASMQEVAEHCAGAVRDRDICKHDLILAEAEEANKLRRLTDDNDKPFSEARVNRELPLTKSVQKATAVMEDAEHSVRIWSALTGAYSDLGSAIRRIADLTTAGYLTPSSAMRDRRDDINELRQQMKEKEDPDPPLKQRGSRRNG